MTQTKAAREAAGSENRRRQELERQVQELGGVLQNFGISWNWYEFPTQEAATTFVDWLTRAGYETPEYCPGWRADNLGKHFVRYHL